MARVTNLELFNRCEAAAHEAADRLVSLGDEHREQGRPLTPERVTTIRNKLREALSAAQELKTRLKKEDGGSKMADGKSNTAKMVKHLNGVAAIARKLATQQKL